MKEFRIGAGGWAYFQAPGLDSLAAYSKGFNFVEVNSTFYTIPNLKKVTSWRRRVQSDFEFSVRCYRDLTHTYKLEPEIESYGILSKMLAICKTLEAKVLHIQTPATLKITPFKIDSIRNLLGSFDLKGIRIAWEVGQSLSKEIPAYLLNLIQDFDIIPCVDISKVEPPMPTDVLYSRLFGKGFHNIYQFDDDELEAIDNRASKNEYEKVMLSFHSMKMYKDAARLKIFKDTGKFPQITNSLGLASLKEVLSEDAKFPSTKEELIQHQGWKIFDLTSTKKVRVYKILEKLPNNTYRNLEDVLKTLEEWNFS